MFKFVSFVSMREDLQVKFWELGYVLRHLKRALTVSEPCTGLCAFRRIAQLAEAPFKVVNAYEIDSRYNQYYDRTATIDCASSITVTCSRHADITQIALSSLENSELFMAGPPCTPWCSPGERAGLLDNRSEPYETCIDMVIELAQRGCLLMFLIENSPEMYGTDFLANMLEKLDACIPFFTIDVKILELNDIWPCKRNRLYVRGMRKDCLLDKIPEPIQYIAHASGANVVFLRIDRHCSKQ